MAEKLTFQYDRESDILYINTVAPYAEQESDELGDEIIARMNPKTGKIENLEVLFFTSRLTSLLLSCSSLLVFSCTDLPESSILN